MVVSVNWVAEETELAKQSLLDQQVMVCHTEDLNDTAAWLAARTRAMQSRGPQGAAIGFGLLQQHVRTAVPHPAAPKLPSFTQPREDTPADLEDQLPTMHDVEPDPEVDT